MGDETKVYEVENVKVIPKITVKLDVHGDVRGFIPVEQAGWEGPIQDGLPKYCSWCGADMVPVDMEADHITSPNLKDGCIDCSGECDECNKES
jgi:hypothetical protein